jgi:hypothetical protein
MHVFYPGAGMDLQTIVIFAELAKRRGSTTLSMTFVDKAPTHEYAFYDTLQKLLNSVNRRLQTMFGRGHYAVHHDPRRRRIDITVPALMPAQSIVYLYGTDVETMGQAPWMSTVTDMYVNGIAGIDWSRLVHRMPAMRKVWVEDNEEFGSSLHTWQGARQRPDLARIPFRTIDNHEVYTAAQRRWPYVRTLSYEAWLSVDL